MPLHLDVEYFRFAILAVSSGGIAAAGQLSKRVVVAGAINALATAFIIQFSYPSNRLTKLQRVAELLVPAIVAGIGSIAVSRVIGNRLTPLKTAAAQFFIVGALASFSHFGVIAAQQGKL